MTFAVGNIVYTASPHGWRHAERCVVEASEVDWLLVNNASVRLRSPGPAWRVWAFQVRSEQHWRAECLLEDAAREAWGGTGAGASERAAAQALEAALLFEGDTMRVSMALGLAAKYERGERC